MGGVGVSRARRVRCGAVLLPSLVCCRFRLPPSSVAGPSRRVCAVALSPSILFPHVLYGRRPCLLVSSGFVRTPAAAGKQPLPPRVSAVPVVVTAARHPCKCCGAHLYVVSFLPFARLREIRRCPPPPRLPPLHLSVVVLRRLRALPFPSLYVTCVYFSTAVKR